MSENFATYFCFHEIVFKEISFQIYFAPHDNWAEQFPPMFRYFVSYEKN